MSSDESSSSDESRYRHNSPGPRVAYVPTSPSYDALLRAQQNRSVTPVYVDPVVGGMAGSSGAGSSGAGSSGAGSSGAGSSGAGSSGVEGKRARREPDRFVDMQGAEHGKRKSRVRGKQPCRGAQVNSGLQLQMEDLRESVHTLEQQVAEYKEKIRELEAQKREEKGNFDEQRAVYTEKNQLLFERNRELEHEVTIFKRAAKNFEMKHEETKRQLNSTGSVVREHVNSLKTAESSVVAWTAYVMGARSKSKVCMICHEDFNPVLDIATAEEFVVGDDIVEKDWYALDCGDDKAHVVCGKCFHSEAFIRQRRCPARCAQSSSRNVRDKAVKLYW